MDEPGPAASAPTAESVVERIAGMQERVHILTGAICNNNCIFCMEEDRDGRYETNSQTTDETVRWITGLNRNTEEVCFTSGEPTTNPSLARWVKIAHDQGIRRISVMTNARALSHEPTLRRLLAAGMTRFYVSIHGHDAKLHESLTRTPGSFDQTLGGIDNIRKYKSRGIELHTSTVITRRNLPHLGEIYRFLRAHGVDQVVFNVMQANGRANTYFERIFPPYTEIAAGAKAFLDEQGAIEAQVPAFLVDIPLCTTTALPDFNRGYVERYAHYEPPTAAAEQLIPASRLASRTIEREDQKAVKVTRSDLDDAQRQKRAACATCRYDASCEGVWTNYLKRYGWDEFVPVPA
ncbi:MAG: radical SAM protein [Deltaproteobacteria bacterium]|nr:radical SAM protein [Deltaproteobacteria bacterium]